jgi:hypothetical protein
MIWATPLGKGKAKPRKPLTYKDILDKFDPGIGQSQQQIDHQDNACRPAAAEPGQVVHDQQSHDHSECWLRISSYG